MQGRSSLQDKTLRQFARIFAAGKRTKNNITQRRRALRMLRGLHSDAAVDVLVEAYRQLDHEAAPMRREHSEVLALRTSLEAARFRKKLDPIDLLQDGMRELLREFPAQQADAQLAQLVAETRRPDEILSLELILAEGSTGFHKIDLLRRTLRRSLSPSAAIALLRVIRKLGPRGRIFAAWCRSQLHAESATVLIEALRTIAALRARDFVGRLVALFAEV